MASQIHIIGLGGMGRNSSRGRTWGQGRRASQLELRWGGQEVSWGLQPAAQLVVVLVKPGLGVVPGEVKEQQQLHGAQLAGDNF